MYIKLGNKKLRLSSLELSGLILLPVFFCLVFVLLMNISPVYRLEVLMVPGTSPLDELGSGTFKKLGILKGSKNRATRRLLKNSFQQQQQQSVLNFQSKLAILESDELIESYIKSNNLLPILYPKRWDEINQTWKKPEQSVVETLKHSIVANTAFLSMEEYQDKNKYIEPILWRAREMLVKKLKVSTQKQTGIISMSFLWTDAESGAKIVNEMIEFVNSFITGKELKTSQEKIEKIQHLLVNEKNATLRKLLLEELSNQHTTIKIAALTPAFKIISMAKPLKSRTFKFPFIGVTLIYLLGFLTTLLGISRYRYQNFKNLTKQS